MTQSAPWGALSSATAKQYLTIDPTQIYESLPVVTTNPAAGGALASANFDPHAMTPEALMIYLKSRLAGLDKQMDEVFRREQNGEHIRDEVHAIQKMLTSLETDGEKANSTGDIFDVNGFVAELSGHIETIRHLNPKLAEEMGAKLFGDGQIMNKNDHEFTKSELDGTKDYLNIVSKDLDSSSQMDTISLQQAMSARQMAIQLATNLIATLADSAKAVVTNIR